MNLWERKRWLAPAKLNLFLHVKDKRTDGYHEIETVMQTVSLYDELWFSLSATDGDIRFFATGEGLPAVEENLVFRAARLLKESFKCQEGAYIRLEKNIPPCSGLGGGSSDAAAALTGLSRLWGLELQVSELEQLAAELGSDVPFFIRGGASVCRGRGELVNPLQTAGGLDFVVVLPSVGVSTADAYNEFDSLTNEREPVNISRTVESLRAGDPDRLGRNLSNDLQSSACIVCPELGSLHKKLKVAFEATGCCGYSLSGSGSAWFGVYPDRRRASGAARYIRESTGLTSHAVSSV